MKRIGLILFSVFFSCMVFFCFSSCKISDSIRTGYPLWYYYSFPKDSEIVFTAEGKAKTRRQAELFAYSDLIEKLSFYLGYEPQRSSYRELSLTGTIEEYGVYVRRSKTIRDKQGNFTSLILAYAEKDIIEDLRNEIALNLEKKVKEIEELILQGDEYIKTSHDIDGLICYIKSLTLSYGIDKALDEEYRFDTIFDVVVKILKSVKLVIIESNVANSSCTVQVKRKNGLFYSNIVECPVRASFIATDGRNSPYTDSHIFYTSDEGIFDYTVVNPNVIVFGSVVFSLNLDKEIQMLEQVFSQAAQTLREIVSEKNILFNYDIQYSMGTIVISSMNYSSSGDFVTFEDAGVYLSERFKNDGIASVVNNPSYELDNEDLILFSSLVYPKAKVLLITQIGIVDIIYSKTGITGVSMEGKAFLYNISDSKLIWESNNLNAVSIGDNEESASENCRKRLEDIIYSLVKAVYV